jgi:hypothetical protein
LLSCPTIRISRLSVDANQHKIRIGNRFRKGRHSNNTKRLERQNKNISLLTDLHQASEHKSWLLILKEFRNQTMQRPSKEVQDLLFEDMTISIKEGLNMSIRTSDKYINKNTIRYFQQSVNRVRELVNSIGMKEPLLK